MYCPSCGKAVPEDSRFCWHCGASLTAPKTGVKTEWVYKDFLKTWEPGKGGSYVIDNQNTEISTRLKAWNDTQSFLLPEIQKWKDDGWQPVTEIGPAAFSFRYRNGFVGAILGIGTMTHEIFEFRVKMRRPKNNSVEEDTGISEVKITKAEFSKLTYRQKYAVKEYGYLLSPDDAETVGKMLGNFQGRDIPAFCEQRGTKVSSFEQ